MIYGRMFEPFEQNHATRDYDKKEKRWRTNLTKRVKFRQTRLNTPITRQVSDKRGRTRRQTSEWQEFAAGKKNERRDSPRGRGRRVEERAEQQVERGWGESPEAWWTMRRGYYRAPVFLRGGPIGGPLSRDDCNTFGAA